MTNWREVKQIFWLIAMALFPILLLVAWLKPNHPTRHFKDTPACNDLQAQSVKNHDEIDTAQSKDDEELDRETEQIEANPALSREAKDRLITHLDGEHDIRKARREANLVDKETAIDAQVEKYCK